MLNLAVDLDDGLAEKLEAAMLARLQDRLPAVRVEAARALERLADPLNVRLDLMPHAVFL